MSDNELLSAISRMMDERLKPLNEKISSMDERISSLDEKVSSLDEKVSSMDHRITDIQMTLENETNKNIQVIAEGHLDLSRKLDDALKVESEKELMLIRMNKLENEIRRIKEHLEIA